MAVKSAKRPWKFKVNNKLPDFGQTDFKTKTVEINKKLNAKARKAKRNKYTIAKKDLTLINSIVHERLHTRHPKASERTIRRKARTEVSSMGQRAKARAYRLIQRRPAR